MIAEPEDILDFWFGRPGDTDFGQPRSTWFRKDPAFDTSIRERFLLTVDVALAGGLADWATMPAGALALLIVLDQFPRNLFRGDAKAFAGDSRALVLAGEVVDRRWDAKLLPVQKAFAYLPFEHSESLVDQERSVALFAALAEAHPATAGYLDYAYRHRDVIVRFGRFPHRNAALGRPSTPQETVYLALPGAGF